MSGQAPKCRVVYREHLDHILAEVEGMCLALEAFAAVHGLPEAIAERIPDLRRVSKPLTEDWPHDQMAENVARLYRDLVQVEIKPEVGT
jgi:hypothetical protein